MNNADSLIREKLANIQQELSGQRALASTYGKEGMPFAEEMENLREWIEEAHEYSIAYETIVAALEKHPFQLSGSAAVNLLEVGLLMKYKTERKEDGLFDFRNSH